MKESFLPLINNMKNKIKNLMKEFIEISEEEKIEKKIEKLPTRAVEKEEKFGDEDCLEALF